MAHSDRFIYPSLQKSPLKVHISFRLVFFVLQLNNVWRCNLSWQLLIVLARLYFNLKMRSFLQELIDCLIAKFQACFVVSNKVIFFRLPVFHPDQRWTFIVGDIHAIHFTISFFDFQLVIQFSDFFHSFLGEICNTWFYLVLKLWQFNSLWFRLFNLRFLGFFDLIHICMWL